MSGKSSMYVTCSIDRLAYTLAERSQMADMVEMIMDMEDELGVDFEMEGDMKLETIGDLADFIEDKLA